MKGKLLWYSLTAAFLVFSIISLVLEYSPGIKLLSSYWDYVKFILAIMPGVFILIGLFKTWVKRETVVKHLGEGSGIYGYVLGIILAFTCVGGLFVALPIGKQLYDKGCKLAIVFVYLGASCVCRIPMTLWESTLLGYEFTTIRYLVSLPLIVISSIILANLVKIKSIKETD